MNRSDLLASITAVAAILALASPSAAASMNTDAFVANVRRDVDFSRRFEPLGSRQVPSPAVRAFAHREAMEQTIAGNSLVAWTQTHTARGEGFALGSPLPGTAGSPVAPIGDIVAAPLGIVGDVANGVNTLVTGRSVAIDRPLTVTPNVEWDAPTLGARLLPSDAKDLSRLQGMNGHQFDALYRSTQLDSLRQLSTLYRDYAASGDDTALRAMAERELPRVLSRIFKLGKL